MPSSRHVFHSSNPDISNEKGKAATTIQAPVRMRPSRSSNLDVDDTSGCGRIYTATMVRMASLKT